MRHLPSCLSCRGYLRGRHLPHWSGHMHQLRFLRCCLPQRCYFGRLNRLKHFKSAGSMAQLYRPADFLSSQTHSPHQLIHSSTRNDIKKQEEISQLLLALWGGGKWYSPELQELRSSPINYITIASNWWTIHVSLNSWMFPPCDCKIINNQGDRVS